jgi:hypothetical protein
MQKNGKEKTNLQSIDYRFQEIKKFTVVNNTNQ